jgi:hypothetical protein
VAFLVSPAADCVSGCSDPGRRGVVGLPVPPGNRSTLFSNAGHLKS